jgi:hypothetical protein
VVDAGSDAAILLGEVVTRDALAMVWPAVGVAGMAGSTLASVTTKSAKD